MTLTQFSVVLCFGGLLAGCSNGTHPTSPTPPAILGPPPAVATYTLSGEISEMTATGPAPVAGALVLEMATHRAVHTDAQGTYRITGVSLASSSNTISVSKGGYTTATRTAPIAGDTRIDLVLERRPVYSVSGVISEITPAGLAPVEGMDVWVDSYISGDNYVGGHTVTDAQGRYSVRGLWAGSDVFSAIWLSQGDQWIDPRNDCDGCFRLLTITGDTVLDIQLSPSSIPRR